jgi:GDPmannose 4,6-dehydratase
VKEFVEAAFDYAGLDWRKYVKTDPRYLRLTEVDELQADASKAAKELGWQPKVGFEELVTIMVDADMRALGLKPVGKGDQFIKEAFPSRWWEID